MIAADCGTWEIAFFLMFLSWVIAMVGLFMVRRALRGP
jgi:hypothetical protein